MSTCIINAMNNEGLKLRFEFCNVLLLENLYSQNIVVSRPSLRDGAEANRRQSRAVGESRQ